MLYGPHGLLQINYDSLKHCDGDGDVLHGDGPLSNGVGTPLHLEEPVTEANISIGLRDTEKEGTCIIVVAEFEFNVLPSTDYTVAHTD